MPISRHRGSRAPPAQMIMTVKDAGNPFPEVFVDNPWTIAGPGAPWTEWGQLSGATSARGKPSPVASMRSRILLSPSIGGAVLRWRHECLQQFRAALDTLSIVLNQVLEKSPDVGPPRVDGVLPELGVLVPRLQHPPLRSNQV